MARDTQIRLRRAAGFTAIGLLLLIDVLATGFFGGSERTLAILRSVVLPGLPFLEWNVALGITTILMAIAAIGAWLRFGMDWLPLLIIASSVAVAALVMPMHHDTPLLPSATPIHSHAHVVIQASHEFTVVLVIFALLARLRLLMSRVPGVSTMLHRFWPGAGQDPRLEAHLCALKALAGLAPESAWTQRAAAHRRRAMWINRLARFRFSGSPLRGAHAGLRGTLALTGQLSEAETTAFSGESASSIAGVIDSEPTWVRPLDSLIASLALARGGDGDALSRWQAVFSRHFRLHGGRRPAALHRPSMLAIGVMPDWEHAVVTAFARSHSLIDSDDWKALRQTCLGTAARGARDAESLRLIAAGRWWARLERDTEAESILARRSLHTDPLARALLVLAQLDPEENDPQVTATTGAD